MERSGVPRLFIFLRKYSDTNHDPIKSASSMSSASHQFSTEWISAPIISLITPLTVSEKRYSIQVALQTSPTAAATMIIRGLRIQRRESAPTATAPTNPRSLAFCGNQESGNGVVSHSK